MNKKRLYFYMAMLALPALLIVGVGAGFVVAMVPGEIAQIPSETTRNYRVSAVELAEDPDGGERLAERPKGWTQVGKINKAVPWGYVEGEAPSRETKVWVKSGEREWRVVTVPKYRPFPYAAVFYYGAGAVALGLILMTIFAIRYFWRWMKERDDFLAATSHDLTTPVVGLQMMLKLNDVGEAQTIAKRLALVVENVKGFLLQGGRRVPAKKDAFDVAALAREAYRIFAADYEDLHQPVAFGDVEGGALNVLADETLTLQILWNLFGNDLKYAAPYGKVSVRFRREGKFAFVDFVDEGQGMTRYQMRHAFDRYYRAQTVLASGKGGFGIGLCTARDSARRMGGGLSVRANSPTGCVFTLKLPAAETRR